jgi:hypothetical protein
MGWMATLFSPQHLEPALEPTKPPIQQALVLPPLVKAATSEVTIHLHVVLKSRMVDLYSHSIDILHGLVLD